MDSSQQTLQSNGELFLHFEIISELTTIFQNNSDIVQYGKTYRVSEKVTIMLKRKGVLFSIGSGILETIRTSILI